MLDDCTTIVLPSIDHLFSSRFTISRFTISNRETEDHSFEENFFFHHFFSITHSSFTNELLINASKIRKSHETCDAEGSALDNSKVSSVKLPTIPRLKIWWSLLEFCVTLLIPRLAEASCRTRPGLIRESVVFARCRVEIISRTCARILHPLYPLVVNLIIPSNSMLFVSLIETERKDFFINSSRNSIRGKFSPYLYKIMIHHFE